MEEELSDYFAGSVPEEILKERARLYAREEKESRGQVLGSLVIFRLENQWIGVEAGAIRQIGRFENGFVVPRAKPLLQGLINYRGAFYPVVDIRPLLHLAPFRPRSVTSHRLIFFEAAPLPFAVLIDDLYEVVDIYEDNILTQVSRENPEDQKMNTASRLIEAVMEIMINDKIEKALWLKAELLREIVNNSL